MTNKLKAYIEQKGWKMYSDKVAILERLEMGVQTIETLRIALNKPHQTITARLSDLNDAGLIKITPTGGKFSIYSLTTDSERLKVLNQRAEEKYQRWVKIGQENGWLN